MMRLSSSSLFAAGTAAAAAATKTSRRSCHHLFMLVLIVCTFNNGSIIMAQETNSPSPSVTKATSSDPPTFLSISIIEVPTPSPTVPATTVATPPPTTVVTTAAPIASTLAPTVVTNSPTVSPTTNSPTTLTPSVTTGTPTTTGSIGTTTGTPTTLQPSNISTTGAPTTGTPTVASFTTGTPTVQPIDDTTPAPTTTTTVAAPTTSSPTTNPTTTKVISSSSPAPTKATPATTTQSPSNSKPDSSSKPTIYMKPTSTTGLQMTLTGINAISDPSSWASTTSTFFASQYETTGYMSNVKVEIVYSDEKVIQQGQRERRLRNNRRGLQTSNGDSVQVIYEQYTSYTSTNASLTLDDVLQLPLMERSQQDQYIAALKQLSNDYGSLTAVSTISLASDDDGGNGNGNGGDNPNNPDGSGGGSSFPLWAIILIAAGGGVLLLVCLVPILYRKCCRGDASLESIHEQTLSSSRPFNAGGEETVGVTDDDYSRAYGSAVGSGNFSLSDAGGTIGSRTRQTASDTLPQSSENNTIFSDDPTYNEPVYEGGGGGREEILDVYAPAGKLGVVIDTPNDGAPIVHAVKDSSPIADKIQVGDKLVAVDDQDVRTMTAIQVSKLISKKSVNASRKMTVIRHIAD